MTDLLQRPELLHDHPAVPAEQVLHNAAADNGAHEQSVESEVNFPLPHEAATVHWLVDEADKVADSMWKDITTLHERYGEDRQRLLEIAARQIQIAQEQATLSTTIDQKDHEHKAQAELVAQHETDFLMRAQLLDDKQEAFAEASERHQNDRAAALRDISSADSQKRQIAQYIINDFEPDGTGPSSLRQCVLNLSSDISSLIGQQQNTAASLPAERMLRDVLDSTLRSMREQFTTLDNEKIRLIFETNGLRQHMRDIMAMMHAAGQLAVGPPVDKEHQS